MSRITLKLKRCVTKLKEKPKVLKIFDHFKTQEASERSTKWLFFLLILDHAIAMGLKPTTSCSHLNFRYHTCLEQGVPWNSGKCRLWILFERITCHDNNIQYPWSVYVLIDVWKKSISEYSRMLKFISNLLNS